MWNRHEQEAKRRGDEKKEWRMNIPHTPRGRKREDGGMGPQEELRQVGASPGARWERGGRKTGTPPKAPSRIKSQAPRERGGVDGQEDFRVLSDKTPHSPGW